MYGTRDAAQNWEVEYNKFLSGIGFRRGVSSPCVFYCEAKNVRLVVHGDDFTCLGTDEVPNIHEKAIQQSVDAELRGRLGEDDSDSKQIKV